MNGRGRGEKKKKKKQSGEGEKIQSSGKKRENIDSCNSPGGESFCLVFIETAGGWGAPPWGSGGSQVESSERGGEFPPRSLTVLTAAYWLDVASPLKRDTRLVAWTGVWGRRAGRAGSLSARMCVCVRVCVCQARGQRDAQRWVRWASFTQLCHTFRTADDGRHARRQRRACWKCARVLVCEHLAASPFFSFSFLALCFAAAPLTLRQVYTNSGYFSYT